MSQWKNIILVGLVFLWGVFSEHSVGESADVSLTEKNQQNFYSSILKQKKEISVYLPKGYAKTNRSYPVVYLLKANDFYYGDIESDSLWTINRLQRQHGIPESIFVLIESPHWYQDVINKATDFEQYLNQDLIPFVDKNYRTLKNRSLIGHSYAGAFVTNTAMYKENQFNYLLAISPIYPSVKYVEGIQTRIERNQMQKSALQVFQGDEDDTFVSMLWQSLKQHKVSQLSFSSEKIQYEGHQSVLTSALSHGLRVCFRDFRMPEDQYILSHQLNSELIAEYFEVRNKKYQVSLSEGELQSAITSAAQVYLKEKKFELAFPLWKQSQSKFKGYFMNMIAERFLSMNETSSALIIWKEMVKILPDKSGSFAGLAKGYRVTGQTNLAIKNYTKAVALAMKNKHAKLKYYQQVLAELKKKEGAS